MGGDAAEFGDGRTLGGITESVHRSLSDGGPATDAQLVLMVVRRFNCTPTEAVRELNHNPWIYDLIGVSLYEDAYAEVERWYAMSEAERAKASPPSGRWARMAERNRARILREKFEESDEAKRRAGRG